MPREPAGPAIWHREFGILAMKGPGIKVDERIYGASLIDIGPTILTLMGLPIGEDMDGRPLVEAFVEEPEVKTIAVLGGRGRRIAECTTVSPRSAAKTRTTSSSNLSLWATSKTPATIEVKAAENAEIEAKYNVARTYMWTNRMAAAQNLLEECVRLRPWEERFWMQLAQCYFKENYFRQAEKIVRDLHSQPATFPRTHSSCWDGFNWGWGHTKAAIDLFEQAEHSQARLPRLHINLGAMYMKLRQFDLAERAFERRSISTRTVRWRTRGSRPSTANRVVIRRLPMRPSRPSA